MWRYVNGVLLDVVHESLTRDLYSGIARKIWKDVGLTREFADLTKQWFLPS